MNSKVVLVLAFVCFAQVFAAPKPIDWNLIGQKAYNFGQRAIPVIRTGCQVLNGQQRAPQYPIFQVANPNVGQSAQYPILEVANANANANAGQQPQYPLLELVNPNGLSN